MPVSSWSTTASSNATADSTSGIIFSEGQAPSSLNDSMRALMAVIKGDFANNLATSGYQKLPNGLIVQWGTATGTTNAFGIMNVVWPLAFPNAVFIAVAMNGDQAVGGSDVVSIAATSSTALDVAWKNPVPANGSARRVNYIVFGR